MRAWDLLSCLNLRETLLRVIAVACYVMQVVVELRTTLAATDTTAEHVLAQLSFDLGVRY